MTKNDILAATQNGLSVFRHYIKGDWRVGKNFRNPFYEDKNASCCIYQDRQTGVYKIKDFGNPMYQGDCFALVAQIANLDCERDFVGVLNKINSDLSLYLETNKSIQTKVQAKTKTKPIVKIPKHDSELTEDKNDLSIVQPPIQKVFSHSELSFWKRCGIDESILNLFHVVSVAEFSGINKTGKPYSCKSIDTQPIFAYQLKKSIKYYMPFSSIRFLYGQKDAEYIFGFDQLPLKGEMIFITGGEKDVMSLYAKGFSAICFNSETANIPKNVVQNLTYRFKHIVVLYDCDPTGLDASARHVEQLKAFHIKRLVLPLSGDKTEKDISDYFALGNTRNDLIRLFINLLKKEYEHTFALLKPCAIDFNDPPIRPEPLITINKVVVASPSNLLAITGSEGSGKSNYIGALVAGALCTAFDDEVDTLGANVALNTEHKAVLMYDTEQTEDQLYRNLKNILRRAGLNHPPKWFNAFGIGNIARKERLRAIVESMDSFYYFFGGIHLVVIDGIADLITSVNDEEESVLLVEELYRLAGFYKTCILVVLHLAPSSYKLRGHLGSEIQRKAAGVLCIEKNENTGNSLLKAIKVREGNPMNVPNMQFAWDELLGYYVLVDSPTKESEPKINLQDLAKELFTQTPNLSYAELCEKIEQKLLVKQRQAKNYIKLLREESLIRQQGGKYRIY